MKALTNRQKSMVCVLIILVIGWILDRCFILPRPSRAVVPDRPEVELHDIHEQLTSLDALGRDALTFKRKLEIQGQAFSVTTMRDPFKVPESWTQKGPQKEKNATVERAMTGRGDSFLENHRLQALISNDEGRVAIVNFEIVKPGQIIDGFLLVEILEEGAVFQSDTETVTMTLNR